MQGVFLFQERSTTMAKSMLQKEYEKELRLLKQRIKRLQKKGKLFSPEKIEAVTRKRIKPKQSTIEYVRSLRGEDLVQKLKPSVQERETKARSPKTATEEYMPSVPTMIEYLTSVFQSLENLHGLDISSDKDTLLSLWFEILSDLEYPYNSPAVFGYDKYLSNHEEDIVRLCDAIAWDSDSGRVSFHFTELFSILMQGKPLTLEQAKALSDIQESAEDVDVD